MSETKNVQIPITLFNDILSFLECLNLSNPSLFNRAFFSDVLPELRKKQHSINLRKTYTKIIYAKNDDQRISARADYMKLKRGGGGR
jgi:hypothetical protein